MAPMRYSIGGSGNTQVNWLILGCTIVAINVVCVGIDQYPHWTFLAARLFKLDIGHLQSDCSNSPGCENDLRENPIATAVGAAIFSMPMLCVLWCGAGVLSEVMFDDKRSAVVCFFFALAVLTCVYGIVLFGAIVPEPCYALLLLASTLSCLPLATAIARHIQIALDAEIPEGSKVSPAVETEYKETNMMEQGGEEANPDMSTKESNVADGKACEGATESDKDLDIAEDKKTGEDDNMVEDNNMASHCPTPSLSLEATESHKDPDIAEDKEAGQDSNVAENNGVHTNMVGNRVAPE